MNPDLPLRKVHCSYCKHWQPVTEEAGWGYCARWEIVDAPEVPSPPGLKLVLSEPELFDRKPVTHESFGCNRIERAKP